AHINLALTPAVHFRPHEAPLDAPIEERYRFASEDDHFVLESEDDIPALRIWLDATWHDLKLGGSRSDQFGYRVERRRGYDHAGTLWMPGTFEVRVERDAPVTVTASAEEPEVVRALEPHEVFAAERERRRRLLYVAAPRVHEHFAAELVLAADQFIVRPVGRQVDVARADAFGDDVRTVIAG